MKHPFQVNHCALVADVQFVQQGVVVSAPAAVNVTLAGLNSAGLVLEAQGRKHVAQVATDGRFTWVHVNGQTYRVRETMPAAAAAAGKGAARQALLAPMTGKVTQVLVKASDTVAAGQELVKMEAMKMEYTLHAESAGRVESVFAVVGTVVDAETVLLHVAATGSKD